MPLSWNEVGFILTREVTHGPMSFDLQRIEEIPKLPGVYLMKDSQGRVLYVGKAKDLRSRVRAYFRQGGDGRHAIRFLLQRVADLEVVVTASEKEALILENTFIKKYRPRYNVAFRDDKNFLHIRIDTHHPYPRLGLVRRPQRDGALYFGPYASAKSVRQTLRMLQRHMGLRTCKDSQLVQGKRTCLSHQMGRCAGVCMGEVTPEHYAAKVQEGILFLQGRSKQLLERLALNMKAASEALRFEEAARIRDQMRAIRRTLEGQRVVTPLGPARDVVGFHRVGEEGMILVLQVREGNVLESLPMPIRPTPLDDQEVLISFLKQFYDAGRTIPPEILVPIPLGEETDLLEQWMGDMAGHRVGIRCPQKGKLRELLAMAQQNAQWAYKGKEDSLTLLQRMAHHLHLRQSPRIMEGFDISTLGGQEAVGAAVRFVDGTPDRPSYRSYGIRTVEGVDDYAMMYELLQRHLQRRQTDGDLPDLLVLDGGKGQLGVAQAALRDLGVEEVEAVALAKGRGPRREDVAESDHVFISGRKEALSLRRDPPVLRIIQHLRDEAHRFAITHHRKRRGRKRLVSALDGIPGVGPVRKQALLKALGSLRKLQGASVEELSHVPGISQRLAQVIYEALREGPPSKEPGP